MTDQNDIELVEKIRESYQPKAQEQTKLEELKNLDKKVKLPAIIFAYVYGIIGALILGTGMCLAMCVFGDAISTTISMSVGIPVGILGIGLVATTYPIYNAILKKRKSKYSQQILDKSNELLNQ